MSPGTSTSPRRRDEPAVPTGPTVRFVFLLGLAVILATTRDAEAYVDPGSGSMLVQLLLGGLMAAVVMVRTWWHRLRGLVGRRTASDEE